MNATLHNTIRSRPWLLRTLELGLPFAGFLVAIWFATQSRAAPQFVLLALLTFIAVNFSIPVARGAVSPILPVIAVTGLLVLGAGPSATALAAGFILAELSRAIWYPLWQNSPLTEIRWPHRLARAIIHVVILLAVAVIYQRAGGQTPLLATTVLTRNEALSQLALLSATYSALYFLASSLLTWIPAQGEKHNDALLLLIMIAVFSQPFALFGTLTYSAVGIPAFVIFCVGAGAFAIITWLSWQRQHVLNQQLDQFAALNSVGASLRETLDLRTVLERTYEQVNNLIPADDFTITLLAEEGTWQRILHIKDGEHEESVGYSPDDLTRWVVSHNRVLDLNRQNMHFAMRRGLTLPEPEPAAWLGVPLTSEKGTSGALVLQRYKQDQPFNRWSRELLLAVAGQVSVALQNARLYSETVRLYNLTDQALAERMEQLQALLNSTSEGVLMLDKAGLIVLVNPPAAHILGSKQDDLQGKQLPIDMETTALGYEAGELQDLLNNLARERHAPSRRTIYTSNLAEPLSGQLSRRFMERYESPVAANDGRLLGWLIIVRDVTEEQERIEWRTNVTRMIVHDLRNPVTTLISNIDQIESVIEAGDAERARQYVVQAGYGCDDMLDMIDSLMDMTRLEAGQLVLDAEAMRLPPLMERVLERLGPLAEQKQIQLSFSAERELPAVWADEELLRRVYVNLLDNALKFTPADGFVQVTMNVEPALDGHEPGVRCTIVDTGPGIPVPDKERIFDRFTRVNVGGGQVRGTGLGLAFCKLAIEAQGGTIWVEDAATGGSCFIFTVPGIPVFN